MDHVLVPIDNSKPARAALEYALEHFPDARFTLLYVADPMIDVSRHRAYPGYTEGRGDKSEAKRGESLLESLADTAHEGTTVETALEVGEPARTIVRYADDHDVDGIVIGSHGRDGIARYLLGSVAETVVRRAGVPVTVVRGSYRANRH